MTGETRGKVVMALENLRSKVLGKILAEKRPRPRAAMAWKQQDKVSAAWRLALPGGDTSLTNQEFSEAAATSLCLPSPACKGRVGEIVKGRKRVDLFGDAIQSTPLKGDHWRQRHNSILHLLSRMCTWAGVECQLEVFNLFSASLRQEGLNRLEKHQQRQGLVPDMRIKVPKLPEPLHHRRDGTVTIGPEPGRPVESQVLHEVKVISCSQTRYKPTWKDRAVYERAKKLQQEYIVKARNADRKYNGVEEGVVGPTERKLLQLGEVRGVVAGNWGEVSEATHALLAHLATSRVRVAGPTRGRRGLVRSEEAERASAISSLRRRLRVAAVRAQCHSLLGRLEALGPGTAAAANRRWQAAEEDRRWRREEAAHNLATRQGWNSYRTGFAKVD